MQLKKLEVQGFRCLVNLSISFEKGLTVIVGENDSGKTSLIDCLKVITQNRVVEPDDFHNSSSPILLKIAADDFEYETEYKNNDGIVSRTKFTATPTPVYLKNAKDYIDSIDCNNCTPEQEDKLKSIAKEFGIIVRTNSKLATLRQNVLQKVDPSEDEGQLTIENTNFPTFSNVQLGGRDFENVSSFFKEVFLKEKQADIWHEKIDEASGKTLEGFVKDRIDSYSEEITEKILETGMLEKMQMFLSNLSEVIVEPIYESKNLNINAKVKFIEDGREVNIDKKGLGTKRRITMALLEFKRGEGKLDNQNTIYLLDEPDTHLHVKAQLELLETLEGFAEQGHQVICTTHSPFIINAVSPSQIRLLQNNQNQSSVKTLSRKKEASSDLLKFLGVENTYLFFARHIIIVEGETEEEFIRAYYKRIKQKPLEALLIKVVNITGVPNVIGFARAITELQNLNNIYLLLDNDASEDIRKAVSRLSIPDERKFFVGTKEFEDAFSSYALHYCWCKHLEGTKKYPERWTVEEIETLREECLKNGGKFSAQLKQLNSGGKKMTKPVFGRILGEHVADAEVPQALTSLFESIKV